MRELEHRKTHSIDPTISRFAAIAFFFGSLLVFFVPPIQPPDEDSHFKRLMTCCHGISWRDARHGATVPINLIEWVDSHKNINGNPAGRYSYKRWYEDSHLSRIVKEPRTEHRYSAESVSVVMYLPSLMGFAIGRISYYATGFEFNYPAALYFGRLGNLLFYVAGVCIALAITPAFRATMAFLALTPVSLHLASSVHYDTMTIIPALLLVAVFLRRLSIPGDRLPCWVAIVCVSVFLLANGKFVYLPLALPALLLLNWRDRRESIRHAALMMGSVLLGAGLNRMFFSVGGGADRVAEKTQLAYILRHPVDFGLTLLSTLQEYGSFYAISAFGNLGSLDTNFSLPIVILIIGTVAIGMIGDAGRVSVSIPLKLRALLVAAAVFSFLGFMMATYVIWTSHTKGVGAALVDGVQGRYFLPILPYLIAGLLPTFRWPHFVPDFGAGLLFVATVFLTQTMIVVLLRYWI